MYSITDIHHTHCYPLTNLFKNTRKTTSQHKTFLPEYYSFPVTPLINHQITIMTALRNYCARKFASMPPRGNIALTHLTRRLWQTLAVVLVLAGAAQAQRRANPLVAPGPTAPTISVTGPTTVCPGGSTLLTGSGSTAPNSGKALSFTSGSSSTGNYLDLGSGLVTSTTTSLTAEGWFYHLCKRGS